MIKFWDSSSGIKSRHPVLVLVTSSRSGKKHVTWPAGRVRRVRERQRETEREREREGFIRKR